MDFRNFSRQTSEARSEQGVATPYQKQSSVQLLALFPEIVDFYQGNHTSSTLHLLYQNKGDPQH
jgi:hypothetical protein